MEKLYLAELSRLNMNNYVRLLKYLNQFYKIVPFCEIPKENIPHLILRHDIDVSLILAMKMAEVEHNIGIKSTYFVMLSNNNYNLWEGKNVARIKQISALGHEIGLHYDASQYSYYTDDSIRALKSELQALENLLGKKIKCISSHAPTKSTSFIRLKDCISADDRGLSDIYVHDSRKLWTVRSLDVLLNQHPQRVQLNLHPCHWTREVNKRETKLDKYLLLLLLLLYKLRTIIIRIIHSRESCEN